MKEHRKPHENMSHKKVHHPMGTASKHVHDNHMRHHGDDLGASHLTNAVKHLGGASAMKKHKGTPFGA